MHYIITLIVIKVCLTIATRRETQSYSKTNASFFISPHCMYVCMYVFASLKLKLNVFFRLNMELQKKKKTFILGTTSVLFYSCSLYHIESDVLYRDVPTNF